MTKSFIVSESKLLELLKAQDELNALNCAGVDNWDGCSYIYDTWDGDLQDSDSVPGRLLSKDIEAVGMRL